MQQDSAKRPLIVFGEDWGGHPSSTQHLMKRLAETREIIWVNSIGLRRPRLNRRDMARAANKIGKMFTPSRTPRAPRPAVPKNITIVQPQAVCWPGNRLASTLNAFLLPRCLKPALKSLEMAPILWTSLPTAIDAVGRLGESSVVYYAGDDFAGLAGVDHGPVTKQERQLVARADLVLAASETLTSQLRSDAIALPHGYDSALFSKPTIPARDLPMSGPVAGFYGSISEWLDQELVAKAAEMLPNWTFLFVGPVQTDIARLKKCDNIRFLGPRPHDALPRYSQHWTASLLPFCDNRQIRACNPLKLREYLATGRPVISTDFPALAPYRDAVDVIDGPAALATALGRAEETDTQACQRRAAAVAGESWDARADYLDKLLQRLPASTRERKAA